MLLLLLTQPMHVRPATASFWNLLTVALGNSTNQSYRLLWTNNFQGARIPHTNSKFKHILYNSNLVNNRQTNKHTSMNIFCFMTHTFFFQFLLVLLFHSIEKRDSHRCALKHLVSSDTKIVVMESVLYQPYQ